MFLKTSIAFINLFYLPQALPPDLYTPIIPARSDDSLFFNVKKFVYVNLNSFPNTTVSSPAY